MTNYVDADPRPAEHPTGVVMRKSCGPLGHWYVLVDGRLVGHYTVRAEAEERHGREVRALGVTQ